MKILQTVLLSILILIGTKLEAQEIICTIKGTVVNRDSKELLLCRATEDVRFNATKIPIVDNKFEYELKIPASDKFSLTFSDELSRGSWRPIAFFPENGTTEFMLHNQEDYIKNKVVGGELDKKMLVFNEQKKLLFNPLKKPYFDSISYLRKEEKYLSKEATALFKEMGETEDRAKLQKLYHKQMKMEKSGEMLSPEGKTIQSKLDSIAILERNWQNDYIEKNVDLHSLSLIHSALRNYKYYELSVDHDFIKKILPQFSKKFPSHPTLEKVKNMFTAINDIKVGSKYIDFEAPTINGEMVKLSDKIKGKVALIDLWASWCGPCIQLSKSMIPIYEKYKEKGFEIVGVACEYKNTKAFEKAIKRDKYPWLNLIELDNQNKIWEKYNIAGAGGKTFLVDSNGYIIAIHPSPEEVDKILNELLN